MNKRSWNQKITPEDEKNIIKLYSENFTGSEILKKLNGKFKTTKTIYDCLRKFNINRKEQWEYVSCDHFYFSNINTPNKAYILGLMLADGWIIPLQNRIGIQLQEDDSNIIHRIKQEWKSDNKIIICEKKPFAGLNGNIYKPKPMHRIAINSPKMIEDLESLGIVHKKSMIVTLPILKEYDSHMFRGIIDGDGSIYLHSNKKNRCIRFLGSHYMVAQTCLYLHKRIGITYRRPALKDSISYVDYSTEKDVIPLSLFLYKDIEDSFCIERKKNVIKNYLI